MSAVPTRRYRGAEIVPVSKGWPVAIAWTWQCPTCGSDVECAYQSALKQGITEHAQDHTRPAPEKGPSAW